MTEYLMMTLEDEDAHASQSPKAMSELIERRADFADELRRAGRLKDCGRLRPSKEGKRIRREGDRLEIRDGPFTDEGRALGSYHWVEAGSTATEQAWLEVMDRIDAETRGRLPASSFLGGLRLDPPSAGRRIVTRSERRATLDGPFLESKEVIGGLVLMRMTSLDEAVRWAGGTRFVVHGALEIRELWRT